MDGEKQFSFGANFRKFFFRGLAILLPTVLTIWLLVIAYGFVRDKIADPINRGVRELVVRFSEYPQIVEQEKLDHEAKLIRENSPKLKSWREKQQYKELLQLDTRRQLMRAQWDAYKFPLDLIGLVLAIVLIYIVGVILGRNIGRRLYHRGEELLNRVPLIRNVYPSVKQVTDFFFGAEQKVQFSNVVAVEYPRKGLWSVGLVTGNTMRRIQDQVRQDCLTVFIPSSPTPFTGYVITVPRADTIDLPISIEDALKFAVSGGVLVPAQQKIEGDPVVDPEATAGREPPGADVSFVEPDQAAESRTTVPDTSTRS